MKTRKYSALAAFFGRGKHASEASKVDQTGGEKLARLSAETGVSARALALFSKLDEHKGFTAEAAHKDFGQVKVKQVA